MKKDRAIQILGGSIPSAAAALGVSYQAVNQWPEDLPPRISDRVFAAAVRQAPQDWAVRWPELAQQQEVA